MAKMNLKTFQKLCHQKKWKEVLDYLSGTKDSKKVKKRYLESTDKDGRNCFHNLVIDEGVLHSAPAVALIDTMIKIAGKKYIYTTNAKGQSVLHVYLKEYYAWDDRFCTKLIEQGGKQLILMQDEDGRSLMHSLKFMYVLQNSDSFPLMLEMAPEIFSLQRNNGNTALHDAVEIRDNADHIVVYNESSYFIEWMLEQCSKEVSFLGNNDGNTALHLLCMTEGNDLYTIHKIAKKLLDHGGVDYLLIENNEGKSALDYDVDHRVIRPNIIYDNLLWNAFEAENLEDLKKIFSIEKVRNCGKYEGSYYPRYDNLIRKYIDVRDWEKVRKMLSFDGILHKSAIVDSKSGLVYQGPSGVVYYAHFNMLQKLIFENPPFDIAEKFIRLAGEDGIVNSYSYAFGSLFHLCLENDYDDDILKLLVEIGGKGMLLQQEEDSGYSVLHSMIRSGCETDLIEMAVEKGGTDLLSLRNSSCGETALHLACSEGVDTATITALARASPKKVLLAKNERGKIALHLALQNKLDFKSIEMILTRYHDKQVSMQTISGELALHIACEHGASKEVLNLLLKKGVRAQIRAKTMRGNTVLHLLLSKSPSLDKLKFLLEKGYNSLISEINEREETVLHSLCSYEDGEIDVFNYLVDQMPEFLSQENIDRQTILHTIMCNEVKADFAKVVIERCDDSMFTLQDKWGYTPLHYCTWSEDLHTILIEKAGKGILSILNNAGQNALSHYVSEGSNNEKFSIDLLETADEDIVSGKDIEGLTVLHHACCNEELNPRVLKLILDNADNTKTLLLSTDDNAETALHYACQTQRNFDTIKILVDAGGKELVEMKDKDDRKAASYNDYQLFVDALLSGIAPDYSQFVDDLTCPLCLDDMIDVHYIPICNHRFCKRCITRAVQMNCSKCPVCRAHFDGESDLRKDHIVNKIACSAKAAQYLTKSDAQKQADEIQMLKRKLDEMTNRCETLEKLVPKKKQSSPRPTKKRRTSDKHSSQVLSNGDIRSHLYLVNRDGK